MLWVYLVLMANFFFAWSNIADKILRTKYLRNSFAMTACYGIFVLLFSIVLLPFVITHPLPWKYAIAAFFSGMLVPFSTLLYFRAMSVEEASRVVPLNNFSSIFTLLLAAIFLQEKLSLLSYAAFVLILLGGILITVRRSVAGFRLSRAMFLMLLNSFIGGAALVISKFALNAGFFGKALALFFLGAGLVELSFFAFHSVRTDLTTAFRVNKKPFIIFLLLSNVAFGIGQLLFYTGLRFGPATLVSVLGSSLSLFVLIIATFLSVSFPVFLKEAVDPKTLGLKISAIGLMAAGLCLLYM